MADSDKPSYFVPESFFTLKGKSKDTKSFIFACKRCPKTISASNKSRFNLKNHVKNKHSTHLEEYEKQTGEKDGRKKGEADTEVIDLADEEGESTSTAKKDKSKTDQPLAVLFQKKISQVKLDESISCYLADSVLPFHHVESAGFQSFVYKLLPTNNLIIKSRKTYAGMIQKNYKELKKNISEKLEQARKVNNYDKISYSIYKYM